MEEVSGAQITEMDGLIIFGGVIAILFAYALWRKDRINLPKFLFVLIGVLLGLWFVEGEKIEATLSTLSTSQIIALSGAIMFTGFLWASYRLDLIADMKLVVALIILIWSVVLMYVSGQIMAFLLNLPAMGASGAIGYLAGNKS